MGTESAIGSISSDQILSIVTWIMSTIGYWKIFKKCEVKEYWAAIPLAREYHLSLCAHKEQEGQILVAIMMFIYLYRIDSFLFDTMTGLSFVVLALMFASIVYEIRIFNGLCRVFKKKRGWTALFVFFEAPTALYFGLSKKLIPAQTAEVILMQSDLGESGNSAETIDDGLTVNIKERTAVDFFRRKYLLRDIHMSIPEGHMVLLLGGSGAGKTTYVNAVTGYEKADAQILLNSQDLYKEYGKMKYDVGFVPQQDLVRGNDTVLRTLSDAAALRLPADVPAAKRWERVKYVLEEFGLTSVQHSLVEKLSGGQRKRLSIAMEFISDPVLFILDEPDSGLDGVVARALFEKLRKIADEGRIVMVITHTPDRVIDLFDDVIVLAKDSARTGRLAFYGPVKEAYTFFGKDSMEEILLSINQKDEGGEGRAEEFVGKYAEYAGGKEVMTA